MKARSRVADDVLALVGCSLRTQSEHSLLHLAILSLQFLKGGEQCLEVLSGERVRGGGEWRRVLLLLLRLAVVRVQGRIHGRERCRQSSGVGGVFLSTCTV